MDILKIIEDAGQNLTVEDIEVLETELAMDCYSSSEKVAVEETLSKVKRWLLGEKNAEDTQENTDIAPKRKKKMSNGIVLTTEDLAPLSLNPIVASMTDEERFFQNVKLVRIQSTYKSDFKKLLKTTACVTPDFIEKHYAFFEPWERDAIVMVVQLGDEFLEHYFGALNHTKIAKYQCFSESFFMKHFAQLDSKIVLNNVKNAWSKKENRSPQLSIFLRIKGITY